MDGPPKVRNLELSLHVQQQVFGLDVSEDETTRNQCETRKPLVIDANHS